MLILILVSCACVTVRKITPPPAPRITHDTINNRPSGAGFLAVGPHSASGGLRYTECTEAGGANFELCAGGNASRWTPIIGAGPGGEGDSILSLQSADRWQVASGRVLYPVLLDHGSPAMGERAAAAIGETAVGGPVMGAMAPDLWQEDGDNYVLTSTTSDSLWLYFVASGRNILRRRVSFSTEPQAPPPPPPPPLPTGCSTIDVVGAGVAAANGLYIRMTSSGPGRAGANAVFSKDVNHQIYCVNYSGTTQWHLAHNGEAGSVLYANGNAAAVRASATMPPTWGWNLGGIDPQDGAEVAPAPATLTCKA